MYLGGFPGYGSGLENHRSRSGFSWEVWSGPEQANLRPEPTWFWFCQHPLFIGVCVSKYIILYVVINLDPPYIKSLSWKKIGHILVLKGLSNFSFETNWASYIHLLPKHFICIYFFILVDEGHCPFLWSRPFIVCTLFHCSIYCIIKNDTRLAEVWWTDSDKMLRGETAAV